MPYLVTAQTVVAHELTNSPGISMATLLQKLILYYQVLNPAGIHSKPDDCKGQQGHAGWANTYWQAIAICSAALLQPAHHLTGLTQHPSVGQQKSKTISINHTNMSSFWAGLGALPKLLAQAFLCGDSQWLNVCIVAHSSRTSFHSQIKSLCSKCTIS